MIKLIFVFLTLVSILNIARADFVRQVPNDSDNSFSFIYRAPISSALPLQSPQWQTGVAASPRPWNDSYWPIFKGLLGYRYMDKGNIPKSKDWASHYAYFTSHPPAQYLNPNNQNKRLAPSEKYDLLVGDNTWPLTSHMWKKGATFLQIYGQVPGWFGICHGWAAASHMKTPLPLAGVTAIGANGDLIYFTPTDIRALQSYLWAESAPQALYIGQKCTHGAAPTDSACIDNNPMSWHLAVTNRLGRDGDSMVMDSSSNFEIWNYAVDSYYFRYFNPRTLRTHRDWKDAMVGRDNFVNDPFAAKRGVQTVFVVGVMMHVFFPAAIEPRENSSEDRIYQYQTFIYDLEVDAALNIVGGEWHSPTRPDFLWTFNYDSKAAAPEDSPLASTPPWMDGQALPVDWAATGRKAAQSGRVLRHIVEALALRSQSATSAADDEEDEETEL